MLHVVQEVANVPLREMCPLYRRLCATSRRKLAEVARAFATAGLAVRVEVVVGEPARQIVRLTLARKVDLVVMGSHKIRPGPGMRGWGTTSYKVRIFCQCPILLVK